MTNQQQPQEQKFGYINDWVYVYKQTVPPQTLKDLEVTVQTVGEVYDYRYKRMVKVERPEAFYLYQQNDNILALPRYINFCMALLENNLLIDNRDPGADIDIEIKVPPRNDYQEDAISAILSNEHGIVCAKTAFGKTYVTINAISKLKKKALILVHKSGLVDQWKESFLSYTNLPESEIQIFKGNKFDPLKSITITTVQNIMAKIRSEKWALRELFKSANFGLTVLDECHTTTGPLQTSSVSRWIFSKRIYGLSATPKRGDELDKVINALLGDTIYVDSRKLLPVYVSFVPYNIPVLPKTAVYMRNDMKSYTVKYNKWIKKYPDYIDTCANVIMDLILNNRKILAVGAIKALLDPVYEKVYSLLGDNRMDVGKVMMLHGTTEDTNLDMLRLPEVESRVNCVISTNKFFSEGISIDWFDSLVYLTPPSSASLSSIPQLVGRIVREYKNKKYVLVVDIYNEAYFFEKNRKTSREKAYVNFGYQITKWVEKKECF